MKNKILGLPKAAVIVIGIVITALFLLCFQPYCRGITFVISDSRKKEASFADSKLAKLFIMNQICITNFSFLNL